MDEKKRINVNSGSIVALKAELFKKQEKFRAARVSKEPDLIEKLNTNSSSINEADDSVWYSKGAVIGTKLGTKLKQKIEQASTENTGKKPISTESKPERDEEKKIEEENALKRSREALERKAKIYEERIKNPRLNVESDNEEEDERILVDFERKAYEEKLKARHKREKEQEKRKTGSDYDDELADVEEWTEFVDSLGRTRKCLKKDLQHLKELDRAGFANKQHTSNLSRSNELLSDDLRRELDRQEWEESEKESLKQTGPIHYQNVQFNEIREHGAAYFAFSQQDSERQAQMSLLNKLREQTKDQRLKREKLKAKRKEVMRARLAKVAQRKGIDLPAPTTSSESDDDKEAEDIIETANAREPLRISRLREWDIGKDGIIGPTPANLLPQEMSNSQSDSRKKVPTPNYIEERRNERNEEFAPPSNYSNSVNNKSRYNNKRSRMREEFRSSANRTRLENKNENDAGEMCAEMSTGTQSISRINAMRQLEEHGSQEQTSETRFREPPRQIDAHKPSMEEQYQVGHRKATQMNPAGNSGEKPDIQRLISETLAFYRSQSEN